MKPGRFRWASSEDDLLLFTTLPPNRPSSNSIHSLRATHRRCLAIRITQNYFSNIFHVTQQLHNRRTSHKTCCWHTNIVYTTWLNDNQPSSNQLWTHEPNVRHTGIRIALYPSSSHLRLMFDRSFELTISMWKIFVFDIAWREDNSTNFNRRFINWSLPNFEQVSTLFWCP